MKTEPLSLRFIGLAVALASGLWVAANGLIFFAIYGDALTPLTLPYFENFTTLQRVDYRQFGGRWHIQDQLLVQEDDQAADLFAVLPLTLDEDQPYQFGAHIQVLSGANGAGLLFNMQQKGEKRQSHLVRFGRDGERAYLVFGYFDKNDEFVEQGSLPAPDISQGVDLAVLIHGDFYDVVINREPQQRDIPLHYHGGHMALTTWFSRVLFDDLFITPFDPAAAAISPAASSTDPTLVANPAPVTATAVMTPTFAAPMTATAPVTMSVLYSQNFAGTVDQNQWSVFSGDWRFMPDALVQQQLDGYDYSIGYAGSFSQYAVSVRLQHREGLAGGGLLFNMPNATDKLGGHLVRYYEGQALVWGYFDEQGNFVGQGNTAVEPPGEGVHTLQVVCNGPVYAIFLDERLVVENVPLVTPQGHIGLTASQSVVAFETVEVTALSPLP